MKDLLEVLQKANTLPTSTLLACVVVVICYFGYFLWKHHLSEAAAHEKQKRKLEIIKLALEIQGLQKNLGVASGDVCKNEAVAEGLKTSNESKIESSAKLPSIILRPIKSAFQFLSKRSKWLPFALLGGIVGLVVPLGIAIDALIKMPSPVTADALQVLLWVFSVRLAFTFIVALSVIGFMGVREWGWALVFGCLIGIVAFVLSGYLFGIVLKVWAVFLTARMNPH